MPTGPEMDAVRRNKLDDIQLSSLSSFGTSTPQGQNPGSVPDSARGDVIKSSLLADPSNSYTVPYDMSLLDMDLSSYAPKVPAVKETQPR